MKINDQKDLKKLIELCRKTGVEAIKVDGVELHLGPTPVVTKVATKATKQPINQNFITEDTRIATEQLSDEDLLFYSATGQDFTDQQ